MAGVSISQVSGTTMEEILDSINRQRRDIEFIMENLDDDNIVQVAYEKVTNVLISSANIQEAAIGSAHIGTAQIGNAHIDRLTANKLVVDTADIKDLSVTTAKIGTAQITTALIADAQITTAKIGDAQITNAKIDRATINKLVVDTADIKDLAVTTAKIGLAQITTALIGDAQITNAKIDRASVNKLVVDSADIKDLAVQTAKITDLAVTNAKIANASIDGAAKIQLASITTALIGDAQITSALIKDLAVTNAKINDIHASKLTAGTIDTGLITVSGTGGKLRIAGNRLQVFDNQAVPIERVSLGDVNNDGSVYGFRVRGADGTTILYDHTGVYTQGITDGAITNPKIGSGAVKNENIFAGTITGDRLVADTITSREIFVDSLSAISANIGNITAGDISGVTIRGVTVTGSTVEGGVVRSSDTLSYNDPNYTLRAEMAYGRLKIDSKPFIGNPGVTQMDGTGFLIEQIADWAPSSYWNGTDKVITTYRAGGINVSNQMDGTRDNFYIKADKVGIGDFLSTDNSLLEVGTIKIKKEISDVIPLTAMSLYSGWVAFGSGYSSPRAWKDSSGTVHLTGYIKSGTATGLISTLTQKGFAPDSRMAFAVQTAGGLARVDVNPTTVLGADAGEVLWVSGGNNTWLSLDGISYKAKHAGNP